ncbi:hypothetical protein K2X85_07185, partial [bacterium]|nr:hypothetical protein [bacterium]
VSGRMPIAMMRARSKRSWMDAGRVKFAYHCLPMVIANQMGWWIGNPVDFSVLWNGGAEATDISIDIDADAIGFGRLPARDCIRSNFGEGVITFSIPYLFRTPTGVNLWVRGPVNHPKDGAQPLEGIVETDWAHATFTMNWVITRPNVPIVFKAGEPICQIFPIERGFVESFRPIVCSIQDAPSLEKSYLAWHDGRDQVIADLRLGGSSVMADEPGQHEYLQGVDPTGSSVLDHQTKLHLRDFIRVDPPSEDPT